MYLRPLVSLFDNTAQGSTISYVSPTLMYLTKMQHLAYNILDRRQWGWQFGQWHAGCGRSGRLPGGYTCEKCIRLHLLTDCIRELELELDAFRTIQDAENIIDKSYGEVVTTKVQPAGASVKDVSEQLQNILKGEGEQPEIIVHNGINDTGRQRDGVLRNEYRKLDAARPAELFQQLLFLFLI
eukprot:g29099.t1